MDCEDAPVRGMEARVLSRAAAAGLCVGAAGCAGVLLGVKPSPTHDIGAGGNVWGPVSLPASVLAYNALAFVTLLGALASDAVSVRSDMGFWAYAFVALWGSLSSLLIWAGVGSAAAVFGATFTVAVLFAAGLAVCEFVWTREAQRLRGAIGWSSTPTSHAMWALWAAALSAVIAAAFLAACAGAASDAHWALRVCLPLLAIAWPTALVTYVGLGYAFDASYHPHGIGMHAWRQAGVAVAHFTFSVALLLFDALI